MAIRHDEQLQTIARLFEQDSWSRPFYPEDSPVCPALCVQRASVVGHDTAAHHNGGQSRGALQGVVFVTELNLRRLHYSTQQLGAGKRVRKHVEVAGSVKRVVLA